MVHFPFISKVEAIMLPEISREQLTEGRKKTKMYICVYICLYEAPRGFWQTWQSPYTEGASYRHFFYFPTDTDGCFMKPLWTLEGLCKSIYRGAFRSITNPYIEGTLWSPWRLCKAPCRFMHTYINLYEHFDFFPTDTRECFINSFPYRSFAKPLEP